MKTRLYILTALFGVLLAACSKDKDDKGWVKFADDDLTYFVAEYGESVEIPFTSSRMKSLNAIKSPEGWTIEVSLDNKTIVATAPADAASGVDQGEVTLSGLDTSDNLILKYIDVAKAEYIALDNPENDRQANCMILTEPNKIYTFNPNRRGEQTQEETLKAAKCEIYWRTRNMPVSNLKMMENGSVGVYTRFDDGDYDDDGETTDLVEGNALIVAYDNKENILWSWHLWVTESDPTANPVTIGEVEFLPRNLGALANSINSEEDIADSYGLYYQWGRREPFIYPYYYNAANSSLSSLYSGDSKIVNEKHLDVEDTDGTIDYAKQNPTHFITGADWKSISDDTLWGADGEKSIYDPSPKGWRVPSLSDFTALQWTGNNTLATYGYGAELNNELFMALGRKVYFDGTIQNVSDDGAFGAWAGYYWSCDVVANSKDAKAFQFYLDSKGTRDDKSDDVVVVNHEKVIKRGNGAQIRPVRVK